LNNAILNNDIQLFINENIGISIAHLALKKNPFPTVNWIEILNQIAAKSKAKDKLPTWFSSKNIIYPSKISVEQTSSEKTALYKSTLVSGEKLIDLTGGFGVDDFYFAKKIKNVFHCEMNKELSEIVQHNFEVLEAENIKCYSGDSFEILKNLDQQFDCIYIDPSRRNDEKGKVFRLKDCLPNVPELLNNYLLFTTNILIKTAPILDISAGLGEMKNVKNIHIVAVDNEVKELIWEIQKNYLGTIIIKSINFNKEKTEIFDFTLDEIQVPSNFGLPQKYLFEPNAAIMKSGGFDQVSHSFKINKLHPHSHLYTSNELIAFPGRSFEIIHVIDYNKKEMKRFLERKKANLTIRNFPGTVENIRQKWKIEAGGDAYCFFTTDVNNQKIVLICKKIE
jgi:hypothetical protein